jgi:lipopolysaccharide heptosyltransferase II
MFLQPYNQPGNFIETHKIRRVLIVKLTSLGDVIHALPVAASLKKAFPFLKLHWIVEDRCAPLLENHPLLDSVIVYPRKEIQSLISKRKWGQVLTLLKNLRRSLRELSIDLSLDLQGLAKSGLMVLMAWPPYRMGCFGLKEFSYLISKGLDEGGDLHAVDRNLKLAEFLGAGTGDPEFVMGISEEEKNWAKDFFQRHGVSGDTTLIGLQVGASFPQKCWPIPKMVALIEEISKLINIQVVLLGDQPDQEKLKPYLSRIPRKVINTVGGLSLRQLMTLINHCQIFVGADTGPLHLAVGLGLPVIALCGADDPKWTGPYGPSHRIHYKRFLCSPCNKTPVCQGRFDCMEAIEVEEVMESVKALMVTSFPSGI